MVALSLVWHWTVLSLSSSLHLTEAELELLLDQVSVLDMYEMKHILKYVKRNFTNSILGAQIRDSRDSEPRGEYYMSAI